MLDVRHHLCWIHCCLSPAQVEADLLAVLASAGCALGGPAAASGAAGAGPGPDQLEAAVQRLQVVGRAVRLPWLPGQLLKASNNAGRPLS